MKVTRMGLALLALALALVGCASTPNRLLDGSEQYAKEAARLYTEGSYEESAAGYTSSLAELDKSIDECLADPHCVFPGSQGQLKASLYANRALSRIGAGDYKGAADDARKSISTFESPRGRFALILATAAAGQTDAARAEVPKLRAQDPAKASEAESVLRSPDPAAAVKQAFYARTPFARGIDAYNSKNYKLSLQLWLTVAEKGDSAAQYYVALQYLEGLGVEQSDAKAFAWFLKAAQQGHLQSMSEAGFSYRYGRGVKQDNGEAFKWLQPAAEKGDIRACYELGMVYYHGEGAPKDHQAAFKWFRRAADGKNPDGQVMLGYMYENGQGVKADPAKAVELYGLAADQGSPLGQYNLAVMYQYGTGVAKDEEEAVRLYRSAADNGYEDAVEALRTMGNEGSAAAQYELASVLLEGKTVARNDGEAVALLSRSADQGHAEALETLGDLYVEGKHGVAPDPARGERLLLAAAEQGRVGAMLSLGRLYATGKATVGKDLVRACMWYKVVQAREALLDDLSPLGFLKGLFGEPPSETAAKALKELEKGMTAAQTGEASGRATDWMMKHLTL